MPALNPAQVAKIQTLADYLATNRDQPMPAEVIRQLDLIFGGNSGFACRCGVRGPSLVDSFRDEPIRTFLKLILAINTGALTANPPGPLPP